jgi:hypothetical protein
VLLDLDKASDARLVADAAAVKVYQRRMMDDDVLTQRDTFRDWHSTSSASANVGTR